jgi:hypothetical protein
MTTDLDPSRLPRLTAMARQYFDDRFGPGTLPELPAADVLERGFGRQLDAADEADPLRRGMSAPPPAITYLPPTGWTVAGLPTTTGTVIQYESHSGGRVIASLNIKGHWTVLSIRPSHVVHHLDWEPAELAADLGGAAFYETIPFKRHAAL